MPGGSLHSPIWTPYALYGTVDYIYGFPALEAKNGFTAAQGSLNVVETVMYMVYLYIVLVYGENVDVQGAGAPSMRYWGWISEARALSGREAGFAALLGYTAAIMTVAKTLLYCKFDLLSLSCASLDSVTARWCLLVRGRTSD